MLAVSVDLQQLLHEVQDARVVAGLSAADRDRLVQTMVVDTFAAGEVILRQETCTRNLWLVVAGECDVIKQPPIGELGRPVPLARLESGNVFGEMALVSPEPHVASVEAHTEVRTLRLRGADFDALTQQHPALACQLLKNLLQIVSDRLRAVDDRLSRQLDQHEDLQEEASWQELQLRLGKLYS